MKIITKLTQFDKKDAVLKSISRIIQGNNQLQRQIIANGFLFENLRSEEITELKQRLNNLNYSSYTSTDDFVRILTQNNDFNGLLKIIITILQADDVLAKILWRLGLIIENLTQDQANDLKKLLEADSAQVTITPDENPELEPSHFRAALPTLMAPSSPIWPFVPSMS